MLANWRPQNEKLTYLCTWVLLSVGSSLGDSHAFSSRAKFYPSGQAIFLLPGRLFDCYSLFVFCLYIHMVCDKRIVRIYMYILHTSTTTHIHLNIYCTLTPVLLILYFSYMYLLSNLESPFHSTADSHLHPPPNHTHTLTHTPPKHVPLCR